MESAETGRYISFRALERAHHTIEDFVLTYLPLHGLQPIDFLRWWHLLVFVEGAVYQADEDNEAATAAAAAGELHANEQPGSAGLQAVEGLLRTRGLWTEGVQRELAAGRFYWQEERRLCALMLARPTVPEGGHGAACGFTADEALAASAAKSFDYRMLHHLLCALHGATADPRLLDFLHADELLVDAGDDLTDYEDDIDAGGGGGSFNILRCFVHLHGRQAPLHLAQRLGQLEAERERLLAALPREQQQVVRRRQAEAAGAGGGGLRWQVPPLVLDEAAFRRQFAG